MPLTKLGYTWAFIQVNLDAGWYQFDIDMSYVEINEIWVEVYIRATMLIQNEDYMGDLEIL